MAYIVLQLQQCRMRLRDIKRQSLLHWAFDTCHQLLTRVGAHRPDWRTGIWWNFQPWRLWNIFSAFDSKLKQTQDHLATIWTAELHQLATDTDFRYTKTLHRTSGKNIQPTKNPIQAIPMFSHGDLKQPGVIYGWHGKNAWELHHATNGWKSFKS